MCRWEKEAACRYGDKCKFFHAKKIREVGSEIPTSKYNMMNCRYEKEGRCIYGEECRYNHIGKEKRKEHETEMNKQEETKLGDINMVEVVKEMISSEMEKMRKEIKEMEWIRQQQQQQHEWGFWPANQYMNRQ